MSIACSACIFSVRIDRPFAAVHNERMETRTAPADQFEAWHALPVGEVARRLGVAPDIGLTEAEAESRRARYGVNQLPQAPRRQARQVLWDQFRNLLALVLLAAAVLAAVIGDRADMAIILVVLLVNGLLGFRQEWQAERVFRALQRLMAHHSRVRRDGVDALLESVRLVPGDLVRLEPGDRVPADGRLTAAIDLEVDESLLTGEAKAAVKELKPLPAALGIADRRNMVFMNSVVTRGRASMLVTTTGAATEAGRIAAMLGAIRPGPTPLQGRLDRLGKRLAALAGAAVLIYFVLGALRGEPLLELLLTSLALVVAAIPEGLPAIMSVTLAIGMARMTRHGAVITRRSAIETLGSTTVICSDKTGTLTEHQLAVQTLVFLGRRFCVRDLDAAMIVAEDQGPLPDLLPLLNPAAWCNAARSGLDLPANDPTENALLTLAAKCAVPPERPRLAEIPFDPETRFMATFHRAEDGDVVVCVKGAPDTVLALCASQLAAEGDCPLDSAARDAITRQVAQLGGQALRVLAFASGRLAGARFRPDSLVAGLVGIRFIGLAALVEPPRAEVGAAIRTCLQAGIGVKILTGDHPQTAAALADRLGLCGESLTGVELDAIDDAQLAARLGGVAVLARLMPEHKLRIVRALRAAGEVVAVTGDGVNDAPALQAADIGIAMGRSGSDVARETAQMVLTDDNFATIVAAIREGRGVYDKIVKFIRFQLSTNLGALLTVFLAPLLGLPTPFHPIHILWANIIMDGPPAMALAFDPIDPGIMEQGPRPRDQDFLPWRGIWRLALSGAVMASGTLAVFAISLADGQSAAEARTMAFTTFVLFQFFNLFNARSSHHCVFGRGAPANGKLWLALAAVVALQVMVVHWPPAGALFHTVPLTASEWATAFLVAATVSVVDELWSQTVKRHRGSAPEGPATAPR